MSVSIDVTLPALPARPETGHKGTFGKVLIVAGSRGMSGAASLAGLGALRGGAGLVHLAVPAGILPIVAAFEPSYLTVGLPEDEQGRISAPALGTVMELSAQCTSLAIGPGWGQSPDLRELAYAIYTTAALPVVIDADALNGLARSPGGWPRGPAGVPRVITPHPGEFSRLTGLDPQSIEADRTDLAARFAEQHNLIVLLKGHNTVITDGSKAALNTTGNSGMATGGMGDVLTGLLAALLARGMSAFDAAHLAAHLHGLAGDLAAAELSEPGLIASDLPRYLGKAWQRMGSP
jgi:ADP-dependent NAD(P)H-hydrate dehydratase